MQETKVVGGNHPPLGSPKVNVPSAHSAGRQKPIVCTKNYLFCSRILMLFFFNVFSGCFSRKLCCLSLYLYFYRYYFAPIIFWSASYWRLDYLTLLWDGCIPFWHVDTRESKSEKSWLDWLEMSAGMLQGSFLGPLTFIILTDNLRATFWPINQYNTIRYNTDGNYTKKLSFPHGVIC